MQVWLLFLILFAWFTAIMAAAYGLAVEDARNEVPPEKQRGTSIAPAFPFFPLMIWVAGWAGYKHGIWWLPYLLLYAHLLLLGIAVFSITRNRLRLRRITSRKSAS